MKMVGGGKSGLEKYYGAEKWDQRDEKERIKIASKKGRIKRNRVQKTRATAGKKRQERRQSQTNRQGTPSLGSPELFSIIQGGKKASFLGSLDSALMVTDLPHHY